MQVGDDGGLFMVDQTMNGTHPTGWFIDILLQGSDGVLSRYFFWPQWLQPHNFVYCGLVQYVGIEFP
jgi:hypothetical protein